MLSAIGQVVAAVGVIPSLIYLAVQIREQNKERRRAGINILTAQWSDLVKTAQENRHFAEMFLRGMQSFHDLDAADKLSFSAFFTRFTRTLRECSFTIVTVRWRKRSGKKSSDDDRLFAYPGVRDWWATRKHWLTDEFRAVVEPIIAKNPEPKMYAAYGLDETSNK